MRERCKDNRSVARRPFIKSFLPFPINPNDVIPVPRGHQSRKISPASNDELRDYWRYLDPMLVWNPEVT